MKLPFHAVEVRGDVLFAARGASIHSFNLTDGTHISCSWKYPAAEASKNAAHPRKEDAHLVINVPENSTPAPSQDEQGPPAKRVKLDSGDDVAAAPPATVGEEDQAKDETATLRGGGSGGKKRNKNNKKQASRPGPLSQPTERPMVILMTATQDGRHVVAITSDKTIWVLEHQGQGQLKQLSRRTMPKRPCSVVISPDSKDIFSADKFGDVYSVPLIQSPDWKPDASSSTTAGGAAATPSSPAGAAAAAAAVETVTTTDGQQHFKPQATELTVHTKRNRQALVDQQISRANPKAQRGTPRRVEAEPFERYLLLGHVSLLTAVALGFDYCDDDDVEANNGNDNDTATDTVTCAGTGGGGANSQSQSQSQSQQQPQQPTRKKTRPYILTADRDEHIRVSRGTKDQVHVIERFCLGHDEFVNRLCIPSGMTRAEGGHLLVSAGGDPDLFVWRWKQGQLLAKTPLLDVVRSTGAAPDAAKVAVTGLCQWAFSSTTTTTTTTREDAEEEEGMTRIVVICERVPAVFIFLLRATGALEFSRAVRLAGNPMDVAVVNSETLVVAVDLSLEEGGENNFQTSLVKIARVGDGDYKVADEFVKAVAAVTAELGDDEVDTSEVEIQKLLYSAETLRKMEFEDGGDAD